MTFQWLISYIELTFWPVFFVLKLPKIFRFTVIYFGFSIWKWLAKFRKYRMLKTLVLKAKQQFFLEMLFIVEAKKWIFSE